MTPPSPTHRPAHRTGGWVPNQHGAWFMLAAPLATGMAAGEPRWVHLPLTLFWFAGYFAFFAASQWLKSRFKPRFRRAVLVYSASAAALGAVTLSLDPGLLGYAWWFAPPAAIGLWAAWSRQERAWWAGLATVVAAMLLTPVAYAAGGGSSPRIWYATAVLTGYFAGTVLFVKSMIRERGNQRFRAVSVGYHGAVTAAEAVIAWWLAPFFAVLALRAAVMPRWRLTPQTVGLPEMAFSLAAVLLAVLVV